MINLASESHFYFSEVLEISEEKEKGRKVVPNQSLQSPMSIVTKSRLEAHTAVSVLAASLLSVSSGICDACWERRDTNMNDKWSLSPRAYLSGGKLSLRGIMVACLGLNRIRASIRRPEHCWGRERRGLTSISIRGGVKASQDREMAEGVEELAVQV